MGDSTELSIGMLPLLPLQMFLSIAKSICKPAHCSVGHLIFDFSICCFHCCWFKYGFPFSRELLCSPTRYHLANCMCEWEWVWVCVCALGACEYFSVRVCVSVYWRGLWILIENFAIERCSNCSVFNFKACWNYYFSECAVLLDSVKCSSKWFETGLQQQQQQQYSLFTVLADSSFRFFSFNFSLFFFFIFIFFGHYRAERAAPGP